MHGIQPSACAPMSLRPTPDDSSAKTARCHSAGLRRAAATLGLLLGTVALLASLGLSGAGEIVSGLVRRQSGGGFGQGGADGSSWNNLYLVRRRHEDRLTLADRDHLRHRRLRDPRDPHQCMLYVD